MIQYILVAMAMAATMFVAGCSEERVFGIPPSPERPVVTVAEALEPTALNRTITVRGTIQRVCQEEGCWIVISDGTANLRISFVNGSFAMPLDAAGTVLVEGVVAEELLDAESARAVATSLGVADAEVAAIDGDRRMPLMVASGVAFVDVP